jgi:catechol 2,3-dioxygenase-like lactoylglutathione lyase family enzyme
MNTESKPIEMKLEVVVIGVSDVDRAKAFYEKLGWRLDADFAKGDTFRGIQFTPPNSPTSIIFGRGITAATPGAVQSVTLAVSDVEAARADLITRGIEVSEVFHFAAGPFNDAEPKPRVSGRDPEGRSYYSFASFQDPDGNGWLLQEIQTRLPGREWSAKPKTDVAMLADLLHETEQHHGPYEQTHGKHQWWDWYAAYLNARLDGRSSDDAGSDAERYMADLESRGKPAS